LKLRHAKIKSIVPYYICWNRSCTCIPRWNHYICGPIM